MAEVCRTAEPEIKSAEAKLADLKRMRAIAVSLLGVMTCIFVATSVANAVVEEARDAGLARFSEETGTYEIVDGDGASGDGARA